jgi:hypothetical protein
VKEYQFSFNWKGVVNALVNFGVAENAEKFLGGCTIGGHSSSV